MLPLPPKKYRFFAVALLLLLIVSTVTAADPPATEQRSRNIQYSLPSFFEVVQPMKHPLGGRMPLLVWSLPMPGGQALIWSRRSGALRKAVDELARRGIAPAVMPPGDGAVALARTLQEAGQPVYLSIPRGDQLQATAWQNCTIWVQPPGAKPQKSEREQRWPCLPMNDPATAAKWVEQRVAALHDAQVKVSGAFFDDEGLPQPLPGLLESQRSTAECRAQYPQGLLDDPQQFRTYVMTLRAKLIEQAMTEPIHRLFPGALVGNFGEYSSTQQAPYLDAGGHAYPPLRCGGDLVTPVIYAMVEPAVGADRQVLTQEKLDARYLQDLLGNFSLAAPAAKAYGQLLVPYAGQQVSAGALPRGPLRTMSDSAWRELQWHLWLRGAYGIFLFNPPPSKATSPMSASFRMVENARDIYDQVLAHRQFLENGEPMTYAVSNLLKGDPMWSGLRLPEHCLVRTFSPNPQTQSVKVQAYEQVPVTLDAPPRGAAYLIGRDGKVQKVE
jgi:hypothetical protein